ncbi:MAG: L,D-transpeptidase [Bacteroidales bacterium]|nr:L,D-transpeptidase [Bacteroidales bacterium]
MKTQNSTLEKQINRTVAGQSYLVVNVSTNKFRLFTKGEMVREGLCSTGTNVLLTTDNEKKKWFFSTPKGMHTIIGKTTSPVWIKPDWAFVEEGLPIPPANSDLRYEYGVLGDYAMSLGHGYLIHGTLYKRFLGMPATHGCIRLDDEDLEVVYTTMSIGSKVFIF